MWRVFWTGVILNETHWGASPGMRKWQPLFRVLQWNGEKGTDFGVITDRLRNLLSMGMRRRKWNRVTCMLPAGQTR